jgi:hypothetical protein
MGIIDWINNNLVPTGQDRISTPGNQLLQSPQMKVLMLMRQRNLPMSPDDEAALNRAIGGQPGGMWDPGTVAADRMVGQ